MTDIALGQSIAGSITAADPNIGGLFYDEYNLNLDSFRQLIINVDSSTAAAPPPLIQLINSDTGASVAQVFSVNSASGLTLTETTFPGVNYKVRVSAFSLGDYTISAVDGGKATSIVSNASSLFDSSGGSIYTFIVGTVGASGAYFPLAGGKGLFPPHADIALAPSGQLYGINFSNQLVRIDPSLDRSQQIAGVDQSPLNPPTIKDAAGKNLASTLKSLEFGADNKLYSIGQEPTGGKFYQIDVNTAVATVLANLPAGLGSAGDLVYDAANNRFLAVSQDTATRGFLHKPSKRGNKQIYIPELAVFFK